MLLPFWQLVRQGTITSTITVQVLEGRDWVITQWSPKGRNGVGDRQEVPPEGRQQYLWLISSACWEKAGSHVDRNTCAGYQCGCTPDSWIPSEETGVL